MTQRIVNATAVANGINRYHGLLDTPPPRVWSWSSAVRTNGTMCTLTGEAVTHGYGQHNQQPGCGDSRRNVGSYV